MGGWKTLIVMIVLWQSLTKNWAERIPDKSQQGRSRQVSTVESKRKQKWDDNLDIVDNSRDTRAKCVDIPQNMSLCRNIGYTQMRLPNLLGHDTVKEVLNQAGSWTPLLSTQCSANTQLFLCSLFSPVCLDQPIWPCRSLCMEVKHGCEARMASYGYAWPEMLSCEKLPSDNDLCISRQSYNRSSARGTDFGCKVCQNLTSGFGVIADSFCEVDFVAKIRPEMTVISGGDLKIIPGKKVKFYKTPSEKMMNKQRPMFYVEGGSTCDCFDLSTTSTNSNVDKKSSNNQYLVMGHVQHKQRMILTHVVRYDAKSRAGRKALKALKKPKHRCQITKKISGNEKVDDDDERRLNRKMEKKKLKKNEKKAPLKSGKKGLKKKNKKEKQRPDGKKNKKDQRWKEYVVEEPRMRGLN